LILLLAATRHRFDRPTSLLRERFTAGWFIAVGMVVALSVWALLFAFHDTEYCRGLWWEFAFDARAPRALRATFAAAVVAGVIAVWQLLRLAPGRLQPPSTADLAAAIQIIREQDRSDAHLVMMGDKSVMFSASRRAFLMYAKRGRSWIALYDPVGPRGEWPALIRSFVATAASHGGRAAFYQIRPGDLALYLDAGLKIMKLGEEARVALDGFSLAGSRWSHLRYALKRGERDGLQFRLIPPGEVAAVLPAMRQISDAWLRHRGAREKGFSVASFDQTYLASQSIAMVCQNNRPVAFATIMTTDLRSEATIGVMRYTPDAPAVAMEFLFTALGQALRQDGYQTLSLGMAPLAGLSSLPLSSWWHRAGSLLWRHGGRLYDFQGLRR
ncbi:phosphatidylglycerol lysyltransferase domain-containing protein, partial [Acidisphaera sp. L21]|uniref:phosphatidylglycerol lysyltransferase domain-containing protein n=1 Tax=Acidisphaera sp. L21 TaxID=1641851 RepID=UPI00131DA483